MSDALTPSFEPVHTVPSSYSMTLEHEVGTIFCLSLREPASAGFIWRIDSIPPFLRLVNRAHTRVPPAGGKVKVAVGSSGLRALRFMVLDAGTGSIELTLRRPWMDNSQLPVESASIYITSKASSLINSPLVLGVGALEIASAAMQRLSGLAASGQWSAYAEAAREVGSWLPTEEPDPQHFISRGFGLWDPVRQAFRQSGLAPSDLLESAHAALSANDFSALVQELLDREVMELGPESYLAALLAAGAKPTLGTASDFCPAARAVALADPASLKIFLEHGLDPNAHVATPGGSTPLILLALEKDRLVSMSEKMTCARMLSQAGASLPGAFAASAGPTSMLELLLASEGLLDPTRADHSLYKRNYSFSFNYFDESGIAPSELLPAPADKMGRARILRLLSQPALEADFFDQSAPVYGSSWRARGKAYPWLATAFEILELDSVARSSLPRSTLQRL